METVLFAKILDLFSFLSKYDEISESYLEIFENTFVDIGETFAKSLQIHLKSSKLDEGHLQRYPKPDENLSKSFKICQNLSKYLKYKSKPPQTPRYF